MEQASSGIALKHTQLCAAFDSQPPKPAKQLRGSKAPDFLPHERAIKAIQFAAQSDHKNYNVFIMGRPGFGRHDTARALLQAEAKARPIPQDWVYVNNFTSPHKPVAIALPGGTAERFEMAMQSLINDLANDIPALFEADAYQNQRQLIEQEFDEQHEKEFSELMEAAQARDLVLLRTPMGFMVAATKDNKPLKPEDFEALSTARQDQINNDIAEIQKQLEAVLKQIPKRRKLHRSNIEDLNSEFSRQGVESALAEFPAEFVEIEEINTYLHAVKTDLIENAYQFLESAPAAHAGAFPVATSNFYKLPQYLKYRVNVIVSNGQAAGMSAPVKTEDLPTLSNLVGRIEYTSEMGALNTNFTMIRPGILHQANSGYLLLDVRQVLSEPFAWDALKRCLKTGQISIVSAQDRMSLLSTSSLEPDPIPLNLRVALVGERFFYYLLMAYDPDFVELFKLQADFDDAIVASDEAVSQFVDRIDAIARSSGFLPLDRAAIKRLLVEATRLAEDTNKLSLNTDKLADIVREADHIAGCNSTNKIKAADIDAAIENAELRAARPRELTHEAISRGTLLIETSGRVVGQINALSVFQIGEFRFGRPSRVTAQVRAGRSKVVDIEREVELGGPLHSKGVLILSSYLATHYALDAPLALWASIVFEQSYGGVDGDSASAAELFALLSALSEVPIDQSFAVTGSVNQKGQIQAIGGVNEKIEGFFDTCAARGLTGGQGVMIPLSNVKNLALRPRVIEAVKANKFRIIPLTNINEGLALLTGLQAGAREQNLHYPAESINRKVEERLIGFADSLRKYATEGKNAKFAN